MQPYVTNAFRSVGGGSGTIGGGSEIIGDGSGLSTFRAHHNQCPTPGLTCGLDTGAGRRDRPRRACGDGCDVGL